MLAAAQMLGLMISDGEEYIPTFHLKSCLHNVIQGVAYRIYIQHRSETKNKKYFMFDHEIQPYKIYNGPQLPSTPLYNDSVSLYNGPYNNFVLVLSSFYYYSGIIEAMYRNIYQIFPTDVVMREPGVIT